MCYSVGFFRRGRRNRWLLHCWHLPGVKFGQLAPTISKPVRLPRVPACLLASSGQCWSVGTIDTESRAGLGRPSERKRNFLAKVTRWPYGRWARPAITRTAKRKYQMEMFLINGAKFLRGEREGHPRKVLEGIRNGFQISPGGCVPYLVIKFTLVIYVPFTSCA